MFSIKSPENQVDCIYGVIRPLYIGARLIGFFPFSVKIQSNGKCSKVYFTLIDFVVFVIHLTIYACFAYINIQKNFMEQPAASPLLIFGTRTLLILGITNGILCISADLCNRFTIFKIFVLCQSFDVQMKALGSSPNYKHSKLYVNVYIVAWIVICLVFTSISFLIYHKIYKMEAIAVIFPSYFVLNNVFGIILSIYSFFLFSLKSRYGLINENFSRLSSDTTNIITITTSKKDTIANLMRLAELHDLLSDILGKVMLAVGMCFTYTVFCLFSCYRGWIMRTVDEQKQFNISIVLTMWAIFYHFFVIVILWAGHSMRNEGKFTGILLHRAINKCANAEIVGRLLAFSQQIQHRVPDANCNLFSFDWTLLYSIVAATATYLIILIQFDVSGFDLGPYKTNNMTLAIN